MIVTLIVGLIAGLIAAAVMKTSYPWYVDMIIGVIGAFVGSFLLGLLNAPTYSGAAPGGNIVWDIIVATLGAIALIAVTRFIAGQMDSRT